jgi:hypothetical protein
MAAHAVARKLSAASAYLPAQELFQSIVNQLQSSQTQKMTHSELENLLESQGCELLRRLLQAHIDERSPGTAREPVLAADSLYSGPGNLDSEMW